MNEQALLLDYLKHYSHCQSFRTRRFSRPWRSSRRRWPRTSRRLSQLRRRCSLENLKAMASPEGWRWSRSTDWEHGLATPCNLTPAFPRTSDHTDYEVSLPSRNPLPSWHTGLSTTP